MLGRERDVVRVSVRSDHVLGCHPLRRGRGCEPGLPIRTRPDPEQLAERFEGELANIGIGRLKRGFERGLDLGRGPRPTQRHDGIASDLVLAPARRRTEHRRELVREGRWQGLCDVQCRLSHPGRASRELQHKRDRWLEGLGHEVCTLPTTRNRSRHAGGPQHILLGNSALEEQCLSPRGLAAN